MDQEEEIERRVEILHGQVKKVERDVRVIKQMTAQLRDITANGGTNDTRNNQANPQ